jgi:1-acyl-sn-glycerol-3-phosphate acyltransferase
MRALEGVLERGEPVAIFPEGTRHSGPQIAELFAGAAYLSVKFGVPIVPVGIGGSEHILPKGKLFPRPHRVAVSVGKPLQPPPLEGRARRSAAKLLTEQLQTSLQACFDDAERLAR